ncbi:MAG: malectin domain-containing carbohydrate-binding protein [Verrucomicrobiota bacterium]
MLIKRIPPNPGKLLAFLGVLFIACCQQGFAQKQIAYIHGDVAPDGTVPSGPANPYDQMLLTDSGNTGMSLFKAMVEAEGYIINQYYDQNTTLNASFLNQFDVVIFGLHQKIWSASEKSALDTWIRAGGGMLIYSDSASGGFFQSVGAQNPVGQTVTNNLISTYGMQVTVDQANGTKAYRSGPSPTHPIVAGRPIFEGEGVSPVAVAANSGVEILIPYENNPNYTVSGSANIPHQQNITISNPSFAALALKPLGNGNLIVQFDRQPMWNNGPGSSIIKRDNEEILRRIVRFLAGDLGNNSGNLSVSARSELLIAQSGVANLSASVTGGTPTASSWSKVSGPGSVTFGNSGAFNTTASFSLPGQYQLQFSASNGSTNFVDTVDIEVVNGTSVLHAINCGSGILSATTGISYTADNFFTGGHIDAFGGNAVSGTQDDALYNNARSAASSYNVPVANGSYTVLLQFAETFFTANNQRIFDVAIEGTTVLDNLDLHAQAPGKFNAYDAIFDVTITDGSLDLAFSASANNMLLNAFVVVESASLSLPGRIESEDFDQGGQNVAYFDTSAGNSGGQYRSTDVDIQIASEGGFNVGWIAQNEYLNYTVNVAETGVYDFTFRVASAQSTGKTLHIEVDGVDVSGPVNFNTGGAGWQSWQNVVATNINLTAGANQELRVVMDTGGFNINYVDAVLVPMSNQPVRIEAEDFDDGANGVAYSDTTAGNSGNQYRTTDVDIEVSSEGGFNVGWIAAGEYLNYTVDINASGSYDFTFRVASLASTDKTFHVEVDGVNVTGPITFNTGGAGWQSWQNATASNVSLTAGIGREIRIVMDTGSFNINYFEIAPSGQ